MHKQFTNPYRGFDGPTRRLNLDVPVAEVETIRSVLMGQGLLQTAWALFLQHITTYVRKHDLTIADRDKLINYILACCTGTTDDEHVHESNVNPEQTTGANDSRRVGRVRKVR